MASEQEMRAYLASRNLPSSQKLSQLKRVYGSIKQQEARGLTPSLKEAYGHKQEQFKYEPRKQKQLALFTGIFTIEQLRAFVNRSVMQNFTFRVWGILKEGSPKRKGNQMIDYSQPVWQSIGPVNRAFVEHALYNHDTLTGFIQEIANPGQVFIDVFEIEVLDTRSIRP